MRKETTVAISINAESIENKLGVLGLWGRGLVYFIFHQKYYLYLLFVLFHKRELVKCQILEIKNEMT